MSNLQKMVMKSRLPPFAPPSRNREGSMKRCRTKDYTPTMWSEYFTEKKDVQIDEQHIFRVYLSRSPPQDGPLIVLLHGGGFSALTWSHFTTEIISVLHCQCLAIDLRGHGDSVVGDETDLSAETLAKDVSNVLLKLYPENAPPIMLVGHSMGGAISVHIAHMELIPSLLGCVVIDVVEGTAMEALASMQSFLRSRPTHFKSIQHAIEWSIRSGQIRNVDSAKVSMPGQVVNCITGKLATNDLPLIETPSGSEQMPTPFTNPMAISEDVELEADEQTANAANATQTTFKTPFEIGDNKKYTWRIDLAKTEKFWAGWFEGLSQKFLDLRVPKLLLLASIDGLDRTLTVGQMQGKFQMQVLARCGHAVHEDRPHEVAEVIAAYMVRNKFAQQSNDFDRYMPSC